MHQRLVTNSEALSDARRTGALRAALRPAMYGCPDCRTALVIVSPAPMGNCPDCGVQMIVLSADQILVATTA